MKRSCCFLAQRISGCCLHNKLLKKPRKDINVLLFLTQLSIEEGDVNVMILVVREFDDVFPMDLPRLSPRREVEFSIDLVLRAGLVFLF